MKTAPGFFKTTLIGGLLVILPIGLVLIVGLRIIGLLKAAMAPIVSKLLPVGLHFPTLIACLLLLIACAAAGLIARTRFGRGMGEFCERTFLNHIPGYAVTRSLTRRIVNLEEGEEFAPALVEIENALAPAFVVEEHADGRYTVFVPSAPTPEVGAIYIMTADRVHHVDRSFLSTLECISRFGVGSAELLTASRQQK